MKVNAEYYLDKKDKKHFVKIAFKRKIRIFQVFSGRAGKCLVLMAKNYPDGITTEDMYREHNIDDNKLFGELKDQSAFDGFMFQEGRRNNKNIWKLKLEELFIKTEGQLSPIWFGMHTNTNIRKHLEELIIRQKGLYCNILKIPLEIETKSKFLSNYRKIAIDHRRPQSKKGTDNIENLQILSYYVNERKNQVCAKCNEPNCEICALAFPEKSKIIYPTQEDISKLMK